jgi:AcrR family transcriptional regulator
MPRTDNQNQKIRDERQEQILQAALKVFARRGMAAAKIGDIAAEAGLSHGLMYHYFKSKEEIFTVLVKRALEGSALVIEYTAKQPGTPLQQLTWLAEQILQSISGDGAYLFLIMIQAFTSDAVPKEVKEMLNRNTVSVPVQGMIPILAAGQEAGEIVKDDPMKLAVIFYSAMQGLAISRIQQQETPLPDAELIIRFLKA